MGANTPFGERLDFGGAQELFYTETVTEEQAQELGKFLVSADYFDHSSPKTVQITTENNLIQVRFIVEENRWSDADAILAYRFLGARMMTHIFKNKQLEFHLCDKQFQTQQKIEWPEIVSLGLQLRLNSKHEIFYLNTSKTEAEALGALLKETGFFSTGKENIAQLSKTENLYTVRFVVQKNTWNKDSVIQGFALLGTRISSQILNYKPLEIHLCDNLFKTKKRITQEHLGVYGKRFDTGSENIVFFKGDITQKEAEEFGNFLKKIGYFSRSKQMVQLSKTNSVVQARFILKKKKWKKKKFKDSFKGMGRQIWTEIFPDQKIEIHLCDKPFETKSLIPWNEINPYGDKLDIGDGQIVYYKEGATEEDAEKFGRFLEGEGFFDYTGPKSVMLSKTHKGFAVYFILQKNSWKKKTIQKEFKDFGEKLSKEVFEGSPIEVHLCNDKFESKKVVR